MSATPTLLRSEAAGEAAAIPSDIIEVAYQLAAKILLQDGQGASDVLEAIARALLSERTKATEAAAQIADEIADRAYTPFAEAYQHIARAIRNSLNSEGDRT